MQPFNILTNGAQKAFNLLTNRQVSPFSGMGNNPKSAKKAQGNSANTNTAKIQSVTKSNATAAKSGGKFKRSIRQ